MAVPRCEVCKVHIPLCICDQIPKLKTRTHLFLLLHVFETRKPTNTGRLATLCLPENSTCAVRGVKDEQPDMSFLERDDRIPLVLFPSDDAKELTPEFVESIYATGKSATLVVPDGNWGQAARMPGREPALRNLQRVMLCSDSMKTSYRLRREPRLPYGLATMEAIALALRELEGPENGEHVFNEMSRIFRVMVERTLWTRGQLPLNEVFGGIPPQALAEYGWINSPPENQP